MNRTVKNILSHCRNHSGSDYSFTDGGFRRIDPAGEPYDREALLANAQIVKNSRSTTAGLTGGMFLKRYNRRSWWHEWKRRWQLPRPWRCLAAAVYLEQRGFVTPRVLWASRHWLITEPVAAGSCFLDREQPLPGPETAVFLARLHRAGVWHGDVSLRNLYRTGAEFGVIDLDGTRLFPAGVPERYCRKELARLISSWMICARRAQWEFDAAKIIDEFCRAYKNGGGLALHDAQLERRVHYLATRVRKK